MLIDDFKSIVQSENQKGTPKNTIKIILKERLHLLLLDAIFNSSYGKNFLFFGGTCLRICFRDDLEHKFQRLSEDLDFISIETISPEELKAVIAEQLKDTGLTFDIKTTTKDAFEVNRLQINFPTILEDLQIVTNVSEKRKFFVKVEYVKIDAISQVNPKDLPDISTPYASFDGTYNIVLNRLNDGNLMASKMNACAERHFNVGDTGIQIKGRDFYDLQWYMQHGLIPSPFMFTAEHTTLKVILEQIDKKVQTMEPSHLFQDLQYLFIDIRGVQNITENFKRLYEYIRGNWKLFDISQIRIDNFEELPTEGDYIPLLLIFVNEANQWIRFSVSISGTSYSQFENEFNSFDPDSSERSICMNLLNEFQSAKFTDVDRNPRQVLNIIAMASIHKALTYLQSYGKDNLLASTNYQTEMIATNKVSSLMDFISNFEFKYVNRREF